MPSPVGHAVAGLIVALASERRVSARLKTRPGLQVPWTLFLVCMFLAVLPDIDFIYPPFHRGPTHSIGAAAFVMLVVAGVTERITGRANWRIAAVCGLAYFSHVVMDWLAEEPAVSSGVSALWPLSDRMFISGWNLFRSTERINLLGPVQFAHNLRTLAQELILLGPILFWLLWRRAKTSVT